MCHDSLPNFYSFDIHYLTFQHTNLPIYPKLTTFFYSYIPTTLLCDFTHTPFNFSYYSHPFPHSRWNPKPTTGNTRFTCVLCLCSVPHGDELDHRNGLGIMIERRQNFESLCLISILLHLSSIISMPVRIYYMTLPRPKLAILYFWHTKVARLDFFFLFV